MSVQVVKLVFLCPGDSQNESYYVQPAPKMSCIYVRHTTPKMSTVLCPAACHSKNEWYYVRQQTQIGSKSNTYLYVAIKIPYSYIFNFNIRIMNTRQLLILRLIGCPSYHILRYLIDKYHKYSHLFNLAFVMPTLAHCHTW